MDDIKKMWATLCGVGAWLLGSASMFLNDPPGLWFGAPTDSIVIYVRFILSVLSSFILVACHHWQGGRYVKRWCILLIASMLLFIVAAVIYQDLLTTWTCEYVSGQNRVVIGDVYLSKVDSVYSCYILIQDAAGRTDQIWSSSQLIFRHEVIGFLYCVSVMTFSVSVICAVKFVQCYFAGHIRIDPSVGRD